MNRRLHILAPALLAALALAACGSSTHQATVPSLPSSGRRQPTASASSGSLGAWRAAIACARAHGMPNLTDPTLGPDGQVTLPGLAHLPTPTPAAQSACATQLSELQSSGSTDTVEGASDLHALLRVAACMRRHGYPDWPDPNNRGEFHVTSAAAGTPAKMNGAIAACNSLFPASGWHLIVTPSGQ
jgi:hypothetical protein